MFLRFALSCCKKRNSLLVGSAFRVFKPIRQAADLLLQYGNLFGEVVMLVHFVFKLFKSEVGQLG